jgi:probable phosphoglycerate mutase
MAATIWLVRHGATEWSQNGRHTGSTDLPLLPEGRDRAVTLAPVLARHQFTLVLGSPLQRARETAALAGFDDPVLTDDLREWDYGDYEGVTTSTIRQTHPEWSVWDGDMPGGETIEQVAARAARVLARADEVGGDVLLFAHGHILRVLTAVRLGLDPREGRRFVLDPATVSVIGHEHEWPALRRWNSPA